MLTDQDRELINYRPILEYIKADLNQVNNIYAKYTTAPWITITGQNKPTNVLSSIKNSITKINTTLARLKPAASGIDFNSREQVRSIGADTDSEYADLLGAAQQDANDLLSFYVKTIYSILGYKLSDITGISVSEDMAAKEKELTAMLTEYKQAIDSNMDTIDSLKADAQTLNDPRIVAAYKQRKQLKRRYKELKGYQNTITDINQVVYSGIDGCFELATVIGDNLDSHLDYIDCLYSMLMPMQKSTIKEALDYAKLLIYSSFVNINNQTRTNYSHLEGNLSSENKASSLAMLSKDAAVHARCTNVHAGDFSNVALPGKLNSILNDGIAHQHKLYTSHISSNNSTYNMSSQLILANAGLVGDKNVLRDMYSIINYMLEHVDESQGLYAFVKQKVEEWKAIE